MDLKENIENNAKNPSQVSVDGTTVTQHNLKDQIEVDRYLATKEQVDKKNRGLRFNKLVPPGTC